MSGSKGKIIFAILAVLLLLFGGVRKRFLILIDSNGSRKTCRMLVR